MNHTLGAGGPGVAKRALVESQKRIALQILAFITNPPRLIVIVVAVGLDHRTNGLLFALESREPSARHNTSLILSYEQVYTLMVSAGVTCVTPARDTGKNG